MMYSFWKFGLIGAAIVATAALTASATAQITQKGKTYLFRMSYSDGASGKVEIKAQGFSGGKHYAVHTLTKFHVLSVSKGNAKIKYTTTPPVLYIEQNQMKLKDPKSTTVTLELDKYGLVVGDKKAGKAGIGSIAYPEKPLKVGDMWHGITRVPTGMSGEAEAEVLYKFAGFEKIKGTERVKIAFRLQVKGNEDLGGNGFAWLSKKDGSMVQNVTNITTKPGSSYAPMQFIISRS